MCHDPCAVFLCGWFLFCCVDANQRYNFLELRFLNIDNIHKVRGSLGKLSDVVMSGKHSVGELTNWFKTVEDTKWLFLVRTLLYGSIQCAYEMCVSCRIASYRIVSYRLGLVAIDD